MLPDSVQLDVSEAIINQSFSATCLATGYPAPKVNIFLSCTGAVIQNDSIKIDNYTTKMVILINNFPEHCSTISCYSYPFHCTENINVTVATSSLPTNATVITDDPTNTMPSSKASKASSTIMMIILFLIGTVLPT